MLDYPDKYDTKTYFKKRTLKTVIPFLFWSVVGLFFSLFISRTILWEDLSPFGVIDSILHAKYNENYWFFTTLFGVYLSIPLFAYLSKERKTYVLRIMTILSFVLNALIPDIVEVFHIPIGWNIKVTALSPYLFYALIGYILHEMDLSDKKTIRIVCTALIALIILISGYTLKASVAEGSIQNALRANDSSTLILYSAGVYLLIRKVAKRVTGASFVGKTIHFLRKYTFGIYLTHGYVRRALVIWLGINDHSVYYCIFGAFVIILICVCLIWLVRKIPLGRYLLP